MKKRYRDIDVLSAARERIAIVFDNFDNIYCSFSGGKDSTVTVHLVMDEAIRRNRKVGLLLIDLEAQYTETINHAKRIFSMYSEHITPHWACIQLLLRNALTNYEPRWVCWDEEKQDLWVREKPPGVKSDHDYPFFVPKMEFEEFIVLFGEWFGGGKSTAGFIGIRADESLRRYCAIAAYEKKGLLFNGYRWTTKITNNCYNIYPIYDWKTQDIWKYHCKYPDKPHNKIYDKMQMAGVKLGQQRLCQPYGDDQKRGLWLYHILEPETWFKLIARVNGANSGALYIKENGNMTGNHHIVKPDGHTWQSFCNLLLSSLPKPTRDHYGYRFKKWMFGWKKRGYSEIPEEAPRELENKQWAPSWRRLCRCLLRNDYWCKGLGQTQPLSDAYKQYKMLKAEKNKENQCQTESTNVSSKGIARQTRK